MTHDIDNSYFRRTEAWDWLNKEMIHVIDSKAPRMITMDPWPQKIYLDATGERTVNDYITGVLAAYPRGNAPSGLVEYLKDEVRKLVEEGLIALSDVPMALEPHVVEPRTKEGVVAVRGLWKGSYQYDRREQPGVPFEVHIVEEHNGTFTGTVTDDEYAGGTPGTGEISGKLTENGVTFVKRMPVYVESDGMGYRKVDPTRKHRPIYYTGEFSRSKQHLTGTWRFKKRLVWYGWRPSLSGGSGTWTMQKVE